MKHDLDTLAVAVQLIKEFGDDAVTVSRNRLVELIAADNRRAAAFWRAVMRACEDRLANAAGPRADADAQPDRGLGHSSLGLLH